MSFVILDFYAMAFQGTAELRDVSMHLVTTLVLLFSGDGICLRVSDPSLIAAGYFLFNKVCELGRILSLCSRSLKMD